MKRLALIVAAALAPFAFAFSQDARKWVEVKSGVEFNLRGVYFGDATHAWAVGDHGTILHTSDAGKTWQAQKSPSDGTLRGVHFLDETHGCIVGDGDSDAPQARGHILMGKPLGCGTLLVTADAGKTWERQWRQTNFELRGIWMVGDKLGQICNHGGSAHSDGDIIMTTDGKNWTSRRVYRGLNAAFWIDPETGWAVGSRVAVGFFPQPTEPTYTNKAARIVATTDGGKTWAPQNSPPSADLRAVRFTSKDHGVVVGDKGAIQMTNDGGRTWTKVESPTQANLNGVVFADATHGWAVGAGGVILETITAGEEWTEVASPTKRDLLSVHCADKGKAVIAVGAGGEIVRLE
jgi:photosystem II stability/assembly factor-like uncharacterized protein